MINKKELNEGSLEQNIKIKILLFLLHLFSPFIKLLDLIIPKKKNKILFTGKRLGEFFDNPKYLFDYAYKQKKWDLLWLTWHKKDYNLIKKKYSNNSVLFIQGLKGYILLFWNLLRSKGVVIRGQADLYFINKYLLKKRRIIFNLSHAILMKRGGFCSNNLDIEKMKKTIKYRRKITYHSVSSEFEKYFLTAFYFVNPHSFVITGYPRNDNLFKKTNEIEIKRKILKLANIKNTTKIKKIILYAPTHRDATSLLRNKKEGITQFLPFKNLEYDNLLEFLKENKILLILRNHNQDNMFNESIRKKYNQLINSGYVSFMPQEVISDINEIFPAIDILITDYSGIAYDFLICDKPIIFLPYDLEFYNKIKGTIIDYELMTPGDKVYTYNEFKNSIKKAINNPKIYKEERDYFLNLLHQHKDGKSCERIMKLFEKKVPKYVYLK